MKITFDPLQEDEYPQWFSQSTQSYADDKVRSKQWTSEGALKRACADTNRFLPDGVRTADHHICFIVDALSQEKVGSIWWHISNRFGRRIGFIFDFHVYEGYRRRGYATSALKCLKEKLKAEKIEALSLHVFSFNEGAIRLYENLGFSSTSMNMTLELSSK